MDFNLYIGSDLKNIWLIGTKQKKLTKRGVIQTDIAKFVQIIYKKVFKKSKNFLLLRKCGILLKGLVMIHNKKCQYMLEEVTDVLRKVQLAFRPDAINLPTEQTRGRSVTLNQPKFSDVFHISDAFPIQSPTTFEPIEFFDINSLVVPKEGLQATKQDITLPEMEVYRLDLEKLESETKRELLQSTERVRESVPVEDGMEIISDFGPDDIYSTGDQEGFGEVPFSEQKPLDQFQTSEISLRSPEIQAFGSPTMIVQPEDFSDMDLEIPVEVLQAKSPKKKSTKPKEVEPLISKSQINRMAENTQSIVVKPKTSFSMKEELFLDHENLFPREIGQIFAAVSQLEQLQSVDFEQEISDQIGGYESPTEQIRGQDETDLGIESADRFDQEIDFPSGGIDLMSDDDMYQKQDVPEINLIQEHEDEILLDREPDSLRDVFSEHNLMSKEKQQTLSMLKSTGKILSPMKAHPSEVKKEPEYQSEEKDADFVDFQVPEEISPTKRATIVDSVDIYSIGLLGWLNKETQRVLTEKQDKQSEEKQSIKITEQKDVGELPFIQSVQHSDRLTVSRAFYQLLVLKSNDLIDLKQKAPYEEIYIHPKVTIDV
ncbi:scc1 / rad21 family member [Anaeramoeba ignava]|uniref:Scc1 / rad21 family member n=1 Tax=Anaeramoeba ignava TaxID=1746090 RepID=A0A9Q0RCT1_ANAIG|nr:scc1 / rad21 family member [Anaeramoeba ignava]